MTVARFCLAAVAALVMVSSAALAQEDPTTGRIVRIDRGNGTITLQHKQSGTVGAAAPISLVDTYKIHEGLTLNGLNALEAGDLVDFTAAEIGGVRTVMKIQKQ
jgi:Cu/Ag efflux protein CusF